MRRAAVVLVANYRVSVTSLNKKSFSFVSQQSHVRWFATVPSEQKDYFFKTGICSIPHPSKKDKGGEDAHFVSSDSKVIGVADGVGGWTGHGVDPAKYSRSLMEGGKSYCDKMLQITNDENEKNNTTNNVSYNPFNVMAYGWNNALHVKGSSTCCICVLDGLNLNVANVGDSGFLISRKGKVHFKSVAQQYKFNFPYQLGSAIFGHGDDPRVCQRLSEAVEVGDIVVAATDGVFDNVSAEDIVKLMNSAAGSANDLAQKIGISALKEGLKEKGYTSPFSIEAKKNGLHFEGGKLDDITVVVGIVTEK